MNTNWLCFMKIPEKEEAKAALRGMKNDGGN